MKIIVGKSQDAPEQQEPPAQGAADDDDFSAFAGGALDADFDAAMGIQDGDAASDDSEFSADYNDEFDQVMQAVVEEDEFPLHDSADADRPLLLVAEQAEMEEAQMAEREAQHELNALPQNRFAKQFKQFTHCHGDSMRRTDADGKLAARTGRTHPNTRTVTNFQRMAMIKHPPRREARQGHNDYNEAVALVKTTSSSVMQKVLNGTYATIRQTGMTPLGTKHALLKKTNDETEMPVRFTKKESAKWVGWQMQVINRQRYLTEKNIEELKDVLECNHVGIAHVLSQHVQVRYGPGLRQPAVYDVVVPACTVQRTSASNLATACEEFPFEEVSFRYWKDQVIPFLEFALIFCGTDEGPGPERWIRETHEQFHNVQNAAVFSSFCRGHVIGGSSGEALVQEDILPFMQRLGNTLKIHDNFKLWIASQAVQSLPLCGCRITRASEGDYTDRVRASNQFWDRLAPSTVFRESATGARSHPLDRLEDMTEEERQRIAAAEKVLQECWDDIKILMQIDPDNFMFAEHICFKSVCGKFCTQDTWLVRFNKSWSKLMSQICPNRGLKIAKTRFLTWMNMLAMGSLGIFAANLAPVAWLDKWTVEETENDMNRDLAKAKETENDDNKFRAEQSTRLHSVSKGWADYMRQAMWTTSNETIKAVDLWYRYCDRVDASANKGKYPPLLLQLLQPRRDRNPMKVFLAQVGDFFKPESDLNWIIRRWNSTMKVPVFTIRLGFRTLRMLLRIYGRIVLKVVLELETTLRYKIWAVVSAQYYDGETSLPALQVAQSLENFPDCCEDGPFSGKVLGKPRNRGIALLKPDQITACRNFAPDIAQVNLDEERSLSTLREISWGDNACSMQLISDAGYCRQVRVHHERLDGITNAGQVTTAELQKAQLEILERRLPKTNNGAVGRMSAWTMYFRERISPEWEEARSCACSTVQDRISEASKDGMSVRATSQKKYREIAQQQEDGDPQVKAWVKGQADWLTWLDLFKRMTRTYNEDEMLKRSFERKALAWNIEHPESVIELAPEKPLLADDDTFWQMGSFDCPVRHDVIAAEVESRMPEVEESHPTAKRIPGPSRCARAIMADRDGDLFISDPLKPGKLPSLPNERHICCQKWPGLCEKRDNPVLHLTQDIASHMNAIVAYKCEGKGKSEHDMIARVLRFQYVLTDAVLPGEFFHRHADVWVCHVRLEKPQVQVFAPLKEVRPNTWNFMFKGEELYANTSYHQFKLNCWHMIRSRFRVHNVFMKELFLVPHVYDAGEAGGILDLQPVDPQLLGVRPLSADFGDLIQLYPVNAERVKQLRASCTRPKDEAQKHGEGEEAAIDEFTEAMEAAVEKKRQAIMQKYKEQAKRALMAFQKPGHGPRAGGEPKRQRKKGPQGGGNDADPGDEGDGDDPGHGDEGDEVDNADLEDDGLFNDPDMDDHGPMDWELQRWIELAMGPPVPAPASPSALLGAEDQAPLFPPDPGPAVPGQDLPSDGGAGDAPGGGDGGPHQEHDPSVSPLEESRTIGTFGPHKICAVVPKGPDGVRLPNECLTAVYATCGCHLDSVEHRPRHSDGRLKALLPCKQQIAVINNEIGNNSDETILKLKRWLVAGYQVKCECAEMRTPALGGGDIPILAGRCTARRHHMQIRGKHLQTNPPAAALAALPMGHGGFDPAELECLDC